MTIWRLEHAPVPRSICPHCGRPVQPTLRYPWIEAGLGILAAVALALMLAPLGILAWKSCAKLLSDRASHSILYRPLEDWTRY